MSIILCLCTCLFGCRHEHNIYISVCMCLQPKSSHLWQIFSSCLAIYLPQKSSLLWQIVSLCLCVYNQESLLLWQIFSLCLLWKISLLWQIFSLRQHEFLSTYLHVYNNKVAFSGRFWVCVFVSTAKKFLSLADCEFVSTCQ